MLSALIRDRHKPPFGSSQWFKYWAKRLRLAPSLAAFSLSASRFRRRCRSFGDRTFVSPLDVDGPMSRLSIGADSMIGRVLIQLHAEVDIGDCVVLNDGCRLLTGTHDVHRPDWPLVSRPIQIEDYAWVAMGATILPGVVVGRGAIVGAGAVVSKSVEPLDIVVGNPARVVGRRNCDSFDYRPSESVALFEAWLGPLDKRRSRASQAR